MEILELLNSKPFFVVYNYLILNNAEVFIEKQIIIITIFIYYLIVIF